MATVGRHDGGSLDMRTSKIIKDDGSDDTTVWTKIGKGNKQKNIQYAWDCIADANC